MGRYPVPAGSRRRCPDSVEAMGQVDPRAAAFADADVHVLSRRVKGPVLVPGDAGYESERDGFQTALRHRPAVVVGATDAADVQAAVEFARAHRQPVAVQASGHGLSVAADGGVLVSTRRMAGVRVDARAGTAWIEAGVPWGQVIQAAASHGLAPLNGSAPHVGAVGYTLAGGLAALGRRYGYAADHVRRIDVVTADARFRHVTAEDDPDLFWALRGGQGNFGVVTGMEVDLVPVARLYGGGLYFDAGLVADVLRTWRLWTTTMPEELTSSVALIPVPDLPMMPEPIRGRYVAHVRIAHAGDVPDGERLVAPLRAVGPRLIDTLQDMPYTAVDTIFNDPPQPHAYSGTNALLRELDDSVVPAVLDVAGPAAPVRCIVQVNHLGGALARPPAVANAVGHRDAKYLLRVLSPLASTDAAAVQRVHRRLLAELAPWTAGSLVGFLFGESTVEQVRGAYDPDDYRRLTEFKAVYDPDNMFRVNHNVPPAR
jgi:FAD/FMN-containing dehydrogenase